MIFGPPFSTLHEGFPKFWLRQDGKVFIRRAISVITLGSSAFANFAPVLGSVPPFTPKRAKTFDESRLSLQQHLSAVFKG